MPAGTQPVTVRLLGHPLGHSLSPAFQEAAFAQLGIAGRYILRDVSPDELGPAVASLREPDVLGANVTVPYKEAVVPLLDEVSPLAARVGAVNTIVKRGATLRGENTDVGGFLWPLRTGGAAFARWRVVVLGAGGAARAVAVALLEAGVLQLTIANRSVARARALAAALEDERAQALALDDPWLGGALATVTLLVDATAAGWNAAAPVLAPDLLARLPNHALVYDLTYRQTPLLGAAAARGLATLDGLPMLVEQGALAFQLWTGREAPRPVMWAAALAARDDRKV